MNPFVLVLIYITGVAMIVLSNYIWLSGKLLSFKYSKKHRIISLIVVLVIYHIVVVLGLLKIIK